MKQQKNLEKELAEIKQLLTVQSLQNDEPLSIDEACKYTGFKKSYLYQLTHLKKIPFFKPNGKMIYFSKNDLRQWIFQNRHKSRQEIKSESETIMQGMRA